MSHRRSINGNRSRHHNPIPNASRVGPLIMSSVISGIDPVDGTLPDALEDQIANVFAHVKSDVFAAGGQLKDVVKIDFWLKDPVAQRSLLNTWWLDFFPDAESRPARQTHVLSADQKSKVTASFVAYVL